MNDLQLALFDVTEPLSPVPAQRGASLKDRWWAFHCANPHVFTLLRGMALELKSRGYSQCSISLLWERLRWESYIQTQGKGEYKLSNSHRAFYARYLMSQEPELIGFFNLRDQPSQSGMADDFDLEDFV